ncbi:hypothetical protein ACUL41_01290 [Virgibacillus natechei]
MLVFIWRGFSYTEEVVNQENTKWRFVIYKATIFIIAEKMKTLIEMIVLTINDN